MPIVRSNIYFNLSDFVSSVNQVCRFSWIFVKISPELYNSLCSEGLLNEVKFPFQVSPDLLSHFKIEVI